MEVIMKKIQIGVKKSTVNVCNELNYKIYIPSGNQTILVIGLDKLSDRKSINDMLMNKYDFVEQVGFINTNKPELIMAGGEFCGNATRCAIKYYLNNQVGNIKIKVSGVSRKLLGGIDENNNVWVDMPIIKGDYKKSVKIINKTRMIIKLYGITHVVIEEKVNNKNIKEYAKNILSEYNLLNEPASGVMFISKTKTNIKLKPIVYVRDINTLFYETACGSGTTAVGIYESIKCNKDIDINIIQPSKESINVKTKINNNKIENVRISGEVIERS
jgi:diaminopimelate epimerase